MFFKCCQKIVIYLFHLFTPSILGIACQRHARVGLRPTYPPIIARFPPVKNFSYIPGHLQFINEHVVNDINYVSAKEGTVSLEFKTFTEIFKHHKQLQTILLLKLQRKTNSKLTFVE